MRAPLLLVDDEEGFVRTLASRLELRGLPAAVAGSGEEALALLAGGEVETVVLDINLPGRGGLDVLREIRRRWPETEVVLLTGDSGLSTAVAGMKLGAADYLVKPVDVEELAATIRAAGARRLANLESRRMIEAAQLAALGRLAEGVAHEIANPVNNLLSAAGLIEDLVAEDEVAATPQAGELLDATRTVSGNAARCKAILAKLYSLVGKVDPRAAKLDLNAVLAEVLAAERGRMDAAGIALKTDYGRLPACRASAAQLGLVFANIAANAVEAMRERGGVLSVRTAWGPEGVCALVADTGRGIAPEHLAHVLEPFFSTKPVGQGMGLGLSVAHAIVHGLGGRISLRPALGGGTEVSVLLPPAVCAGEPQ